MLSPYLPHQKPPLWAIDPGIIAQNASRMGLPMPVGLWPKWEYSGETAELLSGVRGASLGAVWVPGGLKTDTAGEYIYNLQNANIPLKIKNAFGGDVTLVMRVQVDDTSEANGNLFSVSYDCFELRVYDANHDLYLFIGDSGGVYTGAYISTGGKITYGVPHTIVVVRKGASPAVVDCYIDGVWNKQTSINQVISVPDLELIIGIRTTYTDEAQGIYFVTCLFDQALVSSQAIAISADPYGLVRQPSMEELWAYVAAVGGVAPTGVFYGPLFGPLGGPV